MASAKEIEENQSQFLQIQLARLIIAMLLGVLERWIKWKIMVLTPQQLLQTEIELMTKMREVQEGKASLAAVYKAWTSHPLQKILFRERVRREFLLESNSDDYLGQAISGFTEDEIRSYLIWKSEKHGSVQEWRKDQRRILQILPSKVVGDERNKAKTDHRGLSSGREGSSIRRVGSQDNNKGQEPKTQENRAYGPKGKREKAKETETEEVQ